MGGATDTIAVDRVAYRDGSTLTWIYGDQVGSTTLTRTEAGANRRQRYTPWGELRTNANLTTDRHYTGQIADLETGLAFYNARYYDPVVGQFTAADTIVANPTDGQNFNRYSYVLNNPVKYSDPTGNDVCLGGEGGCGGVREGDFNGDGFVALPDSAGICGSGNGNCRGEGKFMTPTDQAVYFRDFLRNVTKVLSARRPVHQFA